MTDRQEKAPEEQAPVVKHSDEDYLDFLAMIAMEYEDFVEAEKVMDACHLSAENEDRQAARQAYVRAMSASRRERREQKEHHSIATWKGVHCRPTRLMAYILLFMMLIVPVALATVPDACSRMMGLLIDVDEEQQAIGIAMTNQQYAISYIPKEWAGKYYPLYIPNNLKLLSCSSFFDSSEVRFVNEKGEITVFTEYGSDFEISSGVEKSNISTIYVNNSPIIKTISLEQKYIKLVWAIDNRWFVIESYSLSQEDLLPIVNSVQQVFA